MMFGNKFPRSLALAKECASVLRSNPTLAFFPVMSGIAVILASIPFMVPLVLTMQGQEQWHRYHTQFGAAQYALSAGLYFVSTFIVVFFNAALVACANESLQGRSTTMRFGLEQAILKLPQILGWSLIASTVGIILRTIGERSGIIGSIVTSIIGIAWNLAIFFVVPVLVIENVNPIQAVKNSGQMLKQSWGERVILGVGMSSVVAIAMLLAFIPGALAVFAAVNNLFPIAIFFGIATLMYILVLLVAATALNTIFQTSLYLYCRTGVVPNGFQPQSLQGAFQVKPQSKIFSRFG